jgi:hypothetical protein
MPEDRKPYYVMIRKRTIIAAIIAYVSLVALVGISVQVSYYIDQKSNQRWCDIVSLFNESYKEIPPPTDLGKRISAAMLILAEDFKCT